MTNKINFQRLRNSEFIQFMVDLISIFKKFDLNALGISEQLSPVEKDLEIIQTIHGTIKGSDISDELKSIDISRDDCIKGIHTVLKGFTYHFDETIKLAAKNLLDKINSYGSNIAKQNYPTETSSLKGIVEGINNDEKLKNAAMLLNLNDWILQMAKDNDLFNQRYLDRIDETSKQLDEKIKELRKTSIEKYYLLRDHLIAHTTLDKNENYKLLSDQVNVLIENYNNMINRRGNNNSGNSEK